VRRFITPDKYEQTNQTGTINIDKRNKRLMETYNRQVKYEITKNK